MENLSPQAYKTSIYILTSSLVSSTGFEGREEERRPVEREMTPPFWRALAEHPPVVRPRHPLWRVLQVVEGAAGSYLGEQCKKEPVG